MNEESRPFSIAAFGLGLMLTLMAAEGTLSAALRFESRVLQEVNDVRGERHLISLKSSAEVEAVARQHAEHMARSGFFDHINPQGQNPLDRVQQAGIRGFRLLAENIGSTSESGDRVQTLVNAWMNSPVHRENVLNPAFNTTGIGTAQSPSGDIIVVQLFLAVRP